MLVQWGQQPGTAGVSTKFLKQASAGGHPSTSFPKLRLVASSWLGSGRCPSDPCPGGDVSLLYLSTCAACPHGRDSLVGCLFETRYFCVALTNRELAVETRLTWSSQRSVCFASQELGLEVYTTRLAQCFLKRLILRCEDQNSEPQKST